MKKKNRSYKQVRYPYPANAVCCEGCEAVRDALAYVVDAKPQRRVQKSKRRYNE